MARKQEEAVETEILDGVDQDEYLEYFKLEREPFSTTPDPNMAFASKQHEDAIQKIDFYTRRRRGYYVVLGDLGTGKTTLAGLALSNWRLQPELYTAAHITDPSTRTEAAFLRLLLLSLGQSAPRNLLDIKAALRTFLVAEARAKRTVVLLLDEAQKIYPANLDTLHSISNEQTQTKKLLQITMLATPNFQNKVAQHAPLRSRIAGSMTLNPFTPDDAVEMLRYRMEVAGGDFDKLFPTPLHETIYEVTDGVPRELCMLCDACLIETMIRGEHVVTAAILAQVVESNQIKGWGVK